MIRKAVVDRGSYPGFKDIYPTYNNFVHA